MRLSTHRSPNSESAWVAPPGSPIRLEFGKSLRTARLPSNGVAASSISSTRRALETPTPVTSTGLRALACQYRHGALNQALPQVRNGALALMRVLSAFHVLQDLGHGASVHCTAA